MLSYSYQGFMEIFMVLGRFGGQKTKPIKANSPAFSRKSETLSSKPVLSNAEWILNKLNDCQMT